MLATGAAVVVALGVVNFWGDLAWFFRSDSVRIQGKWRLVWVTENGETHTFPFLFIAPRCTLEEKTMTVDDGGMLLVNTYRIETAHRPKWFDIQQYSGQSKPGIYALDGNTLTICLNTEAGGARPATFNSKAGSRHDLFFFKRE